MKPAGNPELGPASIVVVGASGDLARRKIYPALFALYCQGFLPRDFRIFGFARSRIAPEDFTARVRENLTCRYVPGESCEERMDEFLSRCRYVSGEYGSTDAFLDLYAALREEEPTPRMNRVFYLAIPPSVFIPVARAIGDTGMVQCGETVPWSRVVIEKPFGRDRASSDELSAEIAKVFSESQVYRIDHYLGKEVIQNLMVLRFANRIFEPLWNARHVRDVRIDWMEDVGVEGRGGYFDSYGIIRDVMQNHLLQILALTAMEPPARMDAQGIRDAKVRVLRAIPPPRAADLLIGQYAAAEKAGVRLPGYVDDPTVPPGSLTPTFAAAALRVRNPRWEGVPFLLRAGKALNGRMTEIRIRFRAPACGLFADREGGCEPNELVIRVQPDEAIQLRVVSRVPGLAGRMQSRKLDLRYRAAFTEIIPDAYENLLLDVLRGERSLFISEPELEASWDVFTPALRDMESSGRRPEPYAFGSAGPAAEAAWMTRHAGGDRTEDSGTAGAPHP